MKLSLLFILLFGFNSNSQLSYFLEYDGSLKEKLTDITQRRDLVIDNTISIGTKKIKCFFLSD